MTLAGRDAPGPGSDGCLADPPKSLARIHQPAFEAPLKDMAVLVAVAVEAVRKRPLQPVHAIDEVGVTRRE